MPARIGAWGRVLAPVALVLPLARLSAAVCTGDCNDSGTVTALELFNVTFRNAACAGEPVAACGAQAPCNNGDGNGSGAITALELFWATQNSVDPAARGECMPAPTPVPGAEHALTLPAGALAGGVSAVPAIFTGIASFFTGGGSGSTRTCPLMGTVNGTCTDSGPARITTRFVFNGCRVAVPGGSVTLDGEIELRGTGDCEGEFGPFPLFSITAIVDLTTTTRDAGGVVKTAAAADLTAAVGIPTLGGPCFLTALPMVASGDLSTDVPGVGTFAAELTSTTTVLTVTAFSGCRPTDYTVLFSGAAALSVGGSAGPGPTPTPVEIPAQLSMLTVHQRAASLPLETELSGGISSTCFGGALTLSTPEALEIALGELCPTGGDLVVGAAGGAARITYRNDGTVGIDGNGDGMEDYTYPSCLAPALQQCVP